MTEGTWAIAVTVAVFGLGNAGLLIFMLGGFNARIQKLEEESDLHGAEIRDVRIEVGTIKGHLGLQ